MGRILKSKKNKQNTIPKNNPIPIPQDCILTEDVHLNNASSMTFTITNGATGEYRTLNILNKNNNIQDEFPPGHYNDIWNDGDW